MSKAKSAALLRLVGSDDEEEDILAEDTATTTIMAPGRKTRATAASVKGASTTKPPARKALVDKAANIQEKPVRGKGNKRPAAEEITAVVEDELEGESIASDAKPKGARGRPRAAKAPKISKDDEISTTDQLEPTTRPAGRRGRKPKTNTDTLPVEPEIPETQPAEDEVPETQAADTTGFSAEEYDQIEDLPPHNRHGSSSVQRIQSHNIFGINQRTVPASDSDLHEPSMRRRVGDLSRKYENLEAKYRDLREIGIKEAERNYDRLKKQSEERANTANQLIETLKAQLSAQTELAKEAQRLREQLEASQTKADQLQNKVNDTNASLMEAKTEVKTLTTKLAAARSAEVTSKIPGSAIKGSSANNRLLANAEAAAQVAQMKEDLYGDLTGLIVRGVKREQGGETYDCIQTGRNGTLHFKLVVGGEDLTEKLDEPQFMYMPQLDPSRDQDLIDILPDYLAEEITFPQSHAARFYARVMKALTERPEYD
ncbi:chromosome segregation protein Csm1/Pcs1-domain-containing protein [Daldinia vernicosa]|uniref:chromosome segregation protein Csm1/Pcs1-domain-containing protein n=1 Tax=Daldinia vernicosa TaxID=114800 RepID=UPI0020086447|nr:chromosome segregation protein Csm1/Pcs1-domain-containing protein [Daldinia vernicosa]KAI0848109.1 chromosome segregation protein Csm1/Pcs1-domain-containing protein [Daldinia vernicosa]